MMNREGSALTGFSTVFFKELRDNVGSARMLVLTSLIILTAVASFYNAAKTILGETVEDQFLLLSLFTLSEGAVPSFAAFLGFLVPLAGIAAGFDMINSEFQKRTMGRILSFPIYRDALLFGKVSGALSALAIILLSLWLLVMGGAMLVFGIPPTGEQVARAVAFLLITLLYGAVWFVLAMLFSVLFRQPATAALVSIAVWLFFTVFWPMIAGLTAESFSWLGELWTQKIYISFSRISPNTLFGEATLAILNPSTRTLGPVLFSQLQGAEMGSPLPFFQSILLIWPQLTALCAEFLLVFTYAYIRFQRQEIRA